MSQTKKRKLKEKKAPELPVLNPTVAGIDIGATEIYVAVHPDCDPDPVRSFATFTEDLHRKRYHPVAPRGWSRFFVDGPVFSPRTSIEKGTTP